jgi:hypothetical protein
MTAEANRSRRFEPTLEAITDDKTWIYLDELIKEARNEIFESKPVKTGSATPKQSLH